MAESLEQFQGLVASVRTKTGMYFGQSGPPAVLSGIREVLSVVLSLAPRGYAGPVTIILKSSGQISIEFPNLALSAFDPETVEAWMGAFLSQATLPKAHLYNVAFLAAYSEEFAIESGNLKTQATWRFNDSGVKTKRSRRRGFPHLRFTFRPINDYGRALTDDHVYQLGAMLKDLSTLRPGLGTRLCPARWPHELRYFYAHGLRSLLFEEDFARHSLHPACIQFQGEKPGMRVEGCLRFVHAGTPSVRNWVNLHPTQGGAHLTGLGKALTQIFPDARKGCRTARFITNSNIGTMVEVPHSFIGALVLETDDPRYEGPTKDILLGDDIEEFVCEVALQQIPPQWKKLRDAKSV
jgi:DNA gyrase/topoisomerase IV subunit B